MMELFALKLCTAYSNTLANLDRLRQQEKTDPASAISEGYITFLLNTSVVPLIAEVDNIKLDDELIYRCKRFQARLGRQHSRWTAESLLDSLDNFLVDIVRALGKKRFAYIPPASHHLFGQEMPFGQSVYDAIPAARDDIKAAANCLAFGLDTASVFHLMRAAEHGLRKLARKMRVVVLHKKRPSALEDEEWNKIIDAVKRKAEKAHKLISKPKKRARVRLYSDLADHCLFIKDIYRNDVSHTRDPYTTDEAKSAWSRIERFMQLLAQSEAPKPLKKAQVVLAVKNPGIPSASDILSGRVRPKFLGY